MSTAGFEYAYNFNGSNASVPVIQDVTLGVAAAHAKGDLVLIQADGFVDQVVGSIGEVTAVMAETVAAADITAGVTTAKAYILQRNQVWRCSSDAATSTAVKGYTKTLDTTDCNTIDASDIVNGSMIYAGAGDKLDSDGNLIMYVVFADTTYGGV